MFHACSIWRSCMLWKKLQLFENLNDAHVCNLQMKCSMRNRESAFWKKGRFFNSQLWSFVRISYRSENFSFRWCARPIIITSMPMFATYRVKVEQIILFVKVMNWYLEKKKVPQWHQFPRFWWRFCENQGCKNFVLVSCSFKAYCKLHRLAFTWLLAMMDIRVFG